MRRLAILILGLFPWTACFAPPIEIVWRPSLLSNAAILEHFKVSHPRELSEAQQKYWKQLMADRDSIGHVALQIPSADGTPTIYGWHPTDPKDLPAGHPMRDKTFAQMMDWMMMNRSGKFPSVPGQLRNDGDWAARGTRDRPDYTRTIRLEATDEQISQIKRNLVRMQQEGWGYQLIADEEPYSNGKRRYQGKNANCVSAVNEMLKGTGLEADFIPADGVMNVFYKNAQKRSLAWGDVCTTTLAF